jgi:hypothetical protein
MENKEADWKKFQKRLPEWRERYLENITKEIGAVLLGESGTATEKFWRAKKLLDQVAEKLVISCDGCSRSNMLLHLVALYGYGMLGDADLLEFSQELRERILAYAKL